MMDAIYFLRAKLLTRQMVIMGGNGYNLVLPG
jgi:hypothetical protein